MRAPRTSPWALVFAVALDALAGDPPDGLHPVAWFGRSALAYERAARRSSSPARLFVLGAAGALLLPAASGRNAGRLVTRLPRQIGFAVEVALLKSCFAVRGLVGAGRAVRLAVEQGDLGAAHAALGSLVSRPAESLDRRLVLSAAIESLAENVTDSFIAPWLAYAIGGLPAAIAYRGANTLDAMWGYREGDYEWFGKPAARLDDALNYIPARVSAALILLAGALLGLPAANGAEALRAYGSTTASPNAGLTMSAMAGLLGVRLEKPGAYQLGDAHREITAADLATAERLTLIAALLALVFACGVAALRFRVVST